MKSSLIGFSDGSSKAYAAVVYLRNELKNGKISSILVCSKARVAPLEKCDTKKFTIPRLELLSCFILTHLMEMAEKSLTEAKFVISEKRFYSDSTISLGRIKGLENEYHQWVGNRVNAIRAKSQIEDWYYVPTKKNASDLPSRGCSLTELQSCEMWKYGPDFIRETVIPIFPYQNSTNVETEIKNSFPVCCPSTQFLT